MLKIDIVAARGIQEAQLDIMISKLSKWFVYFAYSERLDHICAVSMISVYFALLNVSSEWTQARRYSAISAGRNAWRYHVRSCTIRQLYVVAPPNPIPFEAS